MRLGEAQDMIRGAVGPGDVAFELSRLTQNEYEFTLKQADEFIDYLAQQLTDEEDEDT